MMGNVSTIGNQAIVRPFLPKVIVDIFKEAGVPDWRYQCEFMGDP